MKPDEHSTQPNNFQKGYLALPYEEEDFKEFIVGLLGKPQTITKRLKGVFEIHLQDLQNFHELINQRIVQQNGGKLIQLKTKIYFNDESSVLLSTYGELLTYNEVKPIISEAVKMSWSYLIQFSDKKFPEKQEIEITIISTPDRRLIEDDDLLYYLPKSEFRLNIQHTARSWGSDIESLLSHQINSIVVPQSKWRIFLNRNSYKVATFFGVLIVFSASIGIFFVVRTYVETQTNIVDTEIKRTGTDIIQKMDFLLKYIASNRRAKLDAITTIILTGFLLISVAMGAWVQSLAKLEENSYVILTREAQKAKDRQEKRLKKKLILFLLSFCLSIITGVIANLIFKWIMSR